MHVKSRKKLQKARTSLIVDHASMYGALSMRLELTELPKQVKTCGTDGKRLAYNPEWIDALGHAETVGLLAHEVAHCMLLHPFRRGEREPQRWNVACDMVINTLLMDAGFTLPEGGVIDTEGKYQGKTADQVYADLSSQDQDQQPTPCEWGMVEDPQGNEEGESQGEEDGEGSQSNTDSPDCGNLETEWKIAVKQIEQLEEMRGQGSNSAGLLRLAGEAQQPRVNWRETLQRFVDKSAKEDSTWNPPNRRHIYRGIYLPSSKSEALPPIVIAIDTSGSISDRELAVFSAEITGILETYQTTAHVLYIDTQLNGDAELWTTQDLPVVLNHRGGGGTRFEPAFKYVKDNDLDPVCLIYFTDMGADIPQDVPEYPVLWLNICPHNKGMSVPYGELVTMDINDERDD